MNRPEGKHFMVEWSNSGFTLKLTWVVIFCEQPERSHHTSLHNCAVLFKRLRRTFHAEVCEVLHTPAPWRVFHEQNSRTAQCRLGSALSRSSHDCHTVMLLWRISSVSSDDDWWLVSLVETSGGQTVQLAWTQFWEARKRHTTNCCLWIPRGTKAKGVSRRECNRIPHI